MGMSNEKTSVILIIEDDASIRRSFRNFLMDNDYEILEAENGRVGLDVFEREAPDLVLVDLRMPEVDGLEVLARVREYSPDTPVIVVSGAGEIYDAVETLRLGAWDYLIKPIVDMSVLRHAVEKALERADLIRENRKYQEHLEAEVDRRTKDLEKANAELQQILTDRKQAEKRLRIEHDKLQGVLNVIGEGLYIVNRSFVIEYQNQILENTFGETAGRKCYNVYFSSDKPCTFCPADETIVSGEIRQIEADLPDGRSFDISSSPFNDEDGNVKAILLLRDITEKKTLQAEAVRAGHLASLGELAAGVAHEINNPINGVINYAEILKDAGYEHNENAGIPDRIIKEGERIAKIVKNLLFFARDLKEDYSSAHIKDILSDTFGLVEASVNKDGISFKTDIPASLPNIKARCQEIQQVFLNILSNARHALNKKFPGTNNDKVVEIKGELLDNGGETFVRTVFFDKGTGIPEDVLDKICNPFFSTKPKGEGTGLGLSISHSIVKNHRGRLQFESIEGQYTKVIVDLPIWITG